MKVVSITDRITERQKQHLQSPSYRDLLEEYAETNDKYIDLLIEYRELLAKLNRR